MKKLPTISVNPPAGQPADSCQTLAGRRAGPADILRPAGIISAGSTSGLHGSKKCVNNLRGETYTRTRIIS